jgi:hypothetical protein
MLVRVDGSEPRENVYQHPHAITISWGRKRVAKSIIESAVLSCNLSSRAMILTSAHILPSPSTHSRKYRRSEALQHRFQLCDGCMLMNLSSTFSFRLLRCVLPKKTRAEPGWMSLTSEPVDYSLDLGVNLRGGKAQWPSVGCSNRVFHPGLS